MMNQEIKTKWVAALRSGEYKQSREVLRDDAGFCCLGVLCAISKVETGFGIAATLEETHGDNHIGKTIREWSGLPLETGDEVSINGHRKNLVDHNDDGRTFLEIADAIEEQL